MSASGYFRGHLARYEDGAWRYADTGEPAPGDERACPKCGAIPTLEGYDACLGYIPGATSACCGHGVVPPIEVQS